MVLKECPYVEAVIWGSVAQPPRSPELGAPGISTVWAVCALLLWLDLECCGILMGSVGPQTGWPQDVAITVSGALGGKVVRTTLEGCWCRLGLSIR